MYIVQCVSSFLSLLQILKSVYHIKSIFENLNTAIIVWLIKHFWLKSSRNFCRQNSAKFSANSHDLKHSNYIYYTENHWQQPIYSKKNRGQSKTSFLRLSNGHLHAYFSPACQGPGTGGCMWTLVTLLLLPLLCLLVTLPLLLLLSLSTVLLVSPCHPSLSSATPWLLNFRSNNSSPPHPPPPRLSFSTSLESSHTP